MGGLEVANLFAKISADTSDFSKGMKQVKDDLSFAEKGMGGLQSAVGTGLKMAAGVGVAAIGALSTGIGYAVTKPADMEQGIANIAASMSLGSDETLKLKDYILDLGLDPNLVVDATGAAEAIGTLGTAGLSLDQIMGGAAESTILLSNATGGDMAGSAALMTDLMNQFNISAEDSGRILDQVTGLTVATKFGFEDVAGAFAQVGGVAGSVGLSLEDTAAMLAVTSSNFASGSDAATSMKTMLQRLIPTTSDATDVMASMGIITTDYTRMAEYLSGVLGVEVEPNINAVYEAFSKTEAGMSLAAISQDKLAKGFTGLRAQFEENAFFDDTTGAMKSAEEIAGILQTAFADLSDQQRLEAASTIFGTDAMRTAFGLIEGGADAVVLAKEEIFNTDAQDMAKQRMDTLIGAWNIFLGVVDTLTLSVGDKFLPIAQALVEWLSALAQTYGPPVIEWFGDLAAGVEPVVKWLTETVKTGDLFNESFGAMPKPIQDVITNLTNMITAVADFIAPIVEAIDKVVDWQDVLNAVVVVIASIVIPAIVGFLAAAAPILVTFAALVAASALLRTAWDNDWGGIQTKTKAVFSYLTDTFGDLFATIRDFGGESLGEIIKWATGQETEFSATNKIWETAKETFGKVFTDIGNKLTEWGELAWKWFKENFPQAAEALTTAFDSISTNFKELWDALKPLIDAVVEAFNGLVEDWTTGSSDMSGALQAAKTIMDGIWAIMVTVVTTSINTMINVLTLVAQLLSGDWSGAWTTAQQIVSDVVGAVGSIVETTLTTVGGLFGISKADIKTWYDDTKKNIGDWWTSFSTNIAERDWDGIAEDLMQVFDATGIKDWYTKTTQNIKDWWDTVKTYIVDKDWFKYGSAIIGGLLDGVKDKWKEFTDWTGTTFQGWIDWFDGLFQFGSPSKLMKQRGQWLMEGLSDGIAAAAIMPIDAMDALATAVQGKVDSMVTAVTNSAKTIRDVYNNMPALPEGYWSTPTTPTTTPVVTPAPTPTTPTTPNQVYTGGAGAGSAVGMGEKKVSWGLNMLATLVDTGDTVQDIIDFANQAKSFLTGNGATPLQGSSAENLALRSLTSGGIDSLSVNNLIGQIQTLVSALTRKDGARAEQAFNISVLAPDASLTTQQQLEELVSYLNALYG